MKHLALLSAMLLGCGSGAGTLNEYQPCPATKGLDRGSASNYVLENAHCQPLTDVSVYILITQDMIASNGFGFQLNGATANNLNHQQADWQQYGILIGSDGQVWALVDNWIFPNQLINQWSLIYTLSSGVV